MIRKFKAVGVALIAVAAFAAIAAQSASAKPLTITASPLPERVYFTGHQSTEHVFTTPSGTVKCTTATFTGNQALEAGGAVNELTVTPAYSGCTAFGFATSHVKTNGCTYTFTTPKQNGGAGQVTWDPSQVHILCPAGKTIEITPTTFGVSACTQFVGEQTPTAGHATGSNGGGGAVPMHVTIASSLENIHYTGTGGACGNGETHSDAKYTGNTTVTCFGNAAHTLKVDCTFS